MDVYIRDQEIISEIKFSEIASMKPTGDLSCHVFCFGILMKEIVKPLGK
jgi:hypothetical protein